MINLEKARELLKAAMETKGPDYVYVNRPGDKCFYEPLTDDLWTRVMANADPLPEDDKRRDSGCLVGVALSLAGETFHLGSTSSINSLGRSNLDKITQAAANYFYAAQRTQDAGYTWGQAVESAEGRVSELQIQESEELLAEKARLESLRAREIADFE